MLFCVYVMKMLADMRIVRCVTLILLLTLSGAAFALPTYDRVRAHYTASDAVLLDRHGVPLQTLRVDMTRRRLAWVPLADMSPAHDDAEIAAEDRHF
jgi:penicillin-binding protein 1C